MTGQLILDYLYAHEQVVIFNKPKNQTQPQPRTAAKMRNGEWLCKAWNAGQCSSKESDCPKKHRHLCSVVVKEQKHAERE